MTWETVAYSVSIFLVGFGFFLWGYREGIHYCVRQLEHVSGIARATPRFEAGK